MATYFTFKNGTPHYFREVPDFNECIEYQPYRTTPLILPGAKVKKDPPITECYLRHHPNPAVRAHPAQDFSDVLMKQRVADTMLHRVAGDDATSGRVFHKQFNSPIGLYSDQNIESTIRQTVPTKKNVASFDPSKSETYRAVQEEGYGDSIVHEIPIQVQSQVYHPNRLVPGKKPVSPRPHPASPAHSHVNSMGGQDEYIQQSGAFKRLMYSVMGETDY